MSSWTGAGRGTLPRPRRKSDELLAVPLHIADAFRAQVSRTHGQHEGIGLDHRWRKELNRRCLGLRLQHAHSIGGAEKESQTQIGKGGLQPLRFQMADVVAAEGRRGAPCKVPVSPQLEDLVIDETAHLGRKVPPGYLQEGALEELEGAQGAGPRIFCPGLTAGFRAHQPVQKRLETFDGRCFGNFPGYSSAGGGCRDGGCDDRTRKQYGGGHALASVVDTQGRTPISSLSEPGTVWRGDMCTNLEGKSNGTVSSVTFARSRNSHQIDHCAGSGLRERMKLVAPMWIARGDVKPEE